MVMASGFPFFGWVLVRCSFVSNSRLLIDCRGVATYNDRLLVPGCGWVFSLG